MPELKTDLPKIQKSFTELVTEVADGSKSQIEGHSKNAQEFLNGNIDLSDFVRTFTETVYDGMQQNASYGRAMFDVYRAFLVPERTKSGALVDALRKTKKTVD